MIKSKNIENRKTSTGTPRIFLVEFVFFIKCHRFASYNFSHDRFRCEQSGLSKNFPLSCGECLACGLKVNFSRAEDFRGFQRYVALYWRNTLLSSRNFAHYPFEIVFLAVTLCNSVGFFTHSKKEAGKTSPQVLIFCGFHYVSTKFK